MDADINNTTWPDYTTKSLHSNQCVYGREDSVAAGRVLLHLSNKLCLNKLWF